MMVLGGSEELIELLSNTPVILQGLLAGVDDDAARQAATPGEWTAVEVVGHLADAEERSILRIKQFASEEHPVIDSYDQDEMVERMRYREQSLAAVLARFLTLRQERLALLAGLDEAVWDRPGRHETYGALTLRQITTHMCNHDVNHMAQIVASSRRQAASSK